jgi:hypothetical protein
MILSGDERPRRDHDVAQGADLIELDLRWIVRYSPRMLHTLVLASVFAISSVGCSGDREDIFTLTTEAGQYSTGLVLGSGEFRPLPQDIAQVDLFLVAGNVVSLSGPFIDDAGPLCVKGSGFAEIGDIPGNTDDCVWTGAMIGANCSDCRFTTDNGFLVRDRHHAEVYRLLIHDHGVEAGVASVTFQIK